MDKQTEQYMTTMLSTFSVTVGEARAKRICVECGRCANRGCVTTEAWTENDWTDYDLTAFCPSCIVTEIDRIKAALDRADRENDERNWADLSTFDWKAI